MASRRESGRLYTWGSYYMGPRLLLEAPHRELGAARRPRRVRGVDDEAVADEEGGRDVVAVLLGAIGEVLIEPLRRGGASRPRALRRARRVAAYFEEGCIFIKELDDVALDVVAHPPQVR